MEYLLFSEDAEHDIKSPVILQFLNTVQCANVFAIHENLWEHNVTVVAELNQLLPSIVACGINLLKWAASSSTARRQSHFILIVAASDDVTIAIIGCISP